VQIEKFRNRLEQFSESLSREVYSYYSGIKGCLETNLIYSDNSDLFTLESIREIESESDRTSESFAEKRKSLHRLKWFAIEHYLDSSTSLLSQEISQLETRRVFEWDGKEIVSVQIPLILSQEGNAERRGRLNDMRIAAMQELESLKQAWVARLHSESQRLGFQSYMDAWQHCSGISGADLAAQFDKLIAGTETIYLDRLNDSLQATIGRPADAARHCDAWYWRRKNEAWTQFTQERLIPAVEETFSRLGLRSQNSGSISMDLVARPLKRPRPFCVAIRVPTEIKISLLPRGGYNDYSALLHESGHAYHFAWTSSSLPSEYRIFGDRGLSETYAFLFEYLLTDKEWLGETLGFTAPASLLNFQFLYRSFLIRRNSGKLRYAIAVFKDALPGNAAEFYAKSMRECTGLKHDPELYLEDVTDGFYPADYLRAWIFQVMLKKYLQRKFGRTWYREPSAGNFLREIWKTGLLYSAEELSSELGLGALDAQVLEDEIAEGLQR
jgi:hypothetical protein